MTAPDPTLAAPGVIYLQDGGDYANAYEVTWCQHSVDDADTAYIRRDLHTAAVQAAVAKAVEAERAECITIADDHMISHMPLVCDEDEWRADEAAKIAAAIRARKGDAP